MYDIEWTGLILVLVVSAFLAGAINAIAGGGTLLTFPALLSILGNDAAALANATSTVALLPGSLAGAWGYRQEFQQVRVFAWRMLPVSLLGGLLGSLLLVWYPKEFRVIVPWLIFLAAILFLIQPLVSRMLKKRQAEPQATASPRMQAMVMVFQFLVALYGGYFGAGIGILMLTALGFMNIGNIHRMNAVKTFLAAAINSVSVVIFVLDGMVVWKLAILMSAAAILGGYAGARGARKLSPQLVRGVVILIAFTLAIYYALT